MLDQPSKSVHADKTVRDRMDQAVELIGIGEKDKAKALLDLNVREGCSDSMVLLGTILADGDDTERARSISLFQQAAELGNSSGMRNLAYCYAIGLNTEKDKAKGAQLYIKAAEMGNARAACNIGVMLDYGNGIDQDFYEAFKWYLKSAEGGYSRGMTNLGEYYLWGKGTGKNVREAEEWFMKSGSPRATYRLAEIYLDEPGFTDPDKGIKCLRKAAMMGYSRAMFRYGSVIEYEDRDTAVDLYNRAAMKGNADAKNRLTEMGLPIPAVHRRKQ